jgi:hypothetical protein
MRLPDAIQYIHASGAECRAYLGDMTVRLFEDRLGHVKAVWYRGLLPVVERENVGLLDPVLLTLDWEIADDE